MKRIEKSRHDNPIEQQPKQFQADSGISRHYISGYAKCIRNTNLAMMNLFSDVTILNEDDNTIYPVPIIWGNQEKAAIYAFGEQFVKNPDRKEEGLVDRVILPIMALKAAEIVLDSSRYIYHQARRPMAYGNEKSNYDVLYQFSKGVPVNLNYTLFVWTRYYEHLMQISEQIFQKFSTIAYINVEGIPWETPVKIEGSASDTGSDIEDRQQRLLRSSFNLLVEGHINQPIRRDKTVLKVVQKYAILGDLMPSGEIETLVDEVDPTDKPNKEN